MKQKIVVSITRQVKITFSNEFPLSREEIHELASGLCHTSEQDADDMLEEMDRAGEIFDLECGVAVVSVTSETGSSKLESLIKAIQSGREFQFVFKNIKREIKLQDGVVYVVYPGSSPIQFLGHNAVTLKEEDVDTCVVEVIK